MLRKAFITMLITFRHRVVYQIVNCHSASPQGSGELVLVRKREKNKNSLESRWEKGEQL